MLWFLLIFQDFFSPFLVISRSTNHFKAKRQTKESEKNSKNHFLRTLILMLAIIFLDAHKLINVSRCKLVDKLVDMFFFSVLENLLLIFLHFLFTFQWDKNCTNSHTNTHFQFAKIVLAYP